MHLTCLLPFTSSRLGRSVSVPELTFLDRSTGDRPDRRWFGNTRVIDQKAMETFREKLSEKVNDPYQVVLHKKKLPMGLLAVSSAVAEVTLRRPEKD